MTCKDCYHCDVCEFRNDVRVILSQHCEKWCDKFKDKNEIVELPCKVEDTVYISFDKKHLIDGTVAGVHISTITNRVKSKDMYLVVYFRNSNTTKKFGFNAVGKIVFLSCEEAEAHLKSESEVTEK